MKLINHSLNALHQSQDQPGFDQGSSALRRAALERVEMIIIKSTTNQLLNNSGHINGTTTNSPTHVLIDRDGLVTQFIPFNEQIPVAIAGSWEGIKNLASRSIILTFVNHGRLQKQGENFVSTEEVSVEKTDVFTGIHQNEESLSYWQKFTDSQVTIAEKIIRCLTSAYQVKYILGYEEVCPGLQTDPGPAFPLEIMRRKVIKDQVNELSNTLNYKNVADQLDLGTVLRDDVLALKAERDAKIINIRRKNGGWYKVNIDLGGFVKEEWISI
ncbi:MAG: N-acetylmuramoyl-L-alanine amidase [Bacteroidota bacterium]